MPIAAANLTACVSIGNVSMGKTHFLCMLELLFNACERLYQ
jgi:hypothetical protein